MDGGLGNVSPRATIFNFIAATVFFTAQKFVAWMLTKIRDRRTAAEPFLQETPQAFQASPVKFYKSNRRVGIDLLKQPFALSTHLNTKFPTSSMVICLGSPR